MKPVHLDMKELGDIFFFCPEKLFKEAGSSCLHRCWQKFVKWILQCLLTLSSPLVGNVKCQWLPVLFKAVTCFPIEVLQNLKRLQVFWRKEWERFYNVYTWVIKRCITFPAVSNASRGCINKTAVRIRGTSAQRRWGGMVVAGGCLALT